MEIKININESCHHCAEALKWFKNLNRKHKGRYMHLNMKNFKTIPGILLTPDYNCSGFLTHFHIQKADKLDLLAKFDDMLIMEKEARMVAKLKKEGKWCIPKLIGKSPLGVLRRGKL